MCDLVLSLFLRFYSDGFFFIWELDQSGFDLEFLSWLRYGSFYGPDHQEFHCVLLKRSVVVVEQRLQAQNTLKLLVKL